MKAPSENDGAFFVLGFGIKCHMVVHNTEKKRGEA